MTTYVVTDYDGCDCITAGKRYEATPCGLTHQITSDFGHRIDICIESSAYLNGNSWTVIEEPDTPKTWGEMTDAEKGALLLAHHEGKVIEYMRCGASWSEPIPYWTDDCAYRVKPEPKEPVVGEVVLHTGQPDFYEWAACSDNDDTHTLTLPTLDGQLVMGEFANEDGMKVVIEEKQK